MAEPASASGVTMFAGVGLATLLPFVNGDALIGAVLGASIVAVHTKDVIWYIKIASLFLSVLCGYLFSPDLQVILNTILGKFFGIQIKSIAVVSCVVAVLIVPFIKKLSDWAYKFDLGAVIDGWIDQRIAKRKSKDTGEE